jgi:hypothetical protein
MFCCLATRRRGHESLYVLKQIAITGQIGLKEAEETERFVLNNIIHVILEVAPIIFLAKYISNDTSKPNYIASLVQAETLTTYSLLKNGWLNNIKYVERIN